MASVSSLLSLGASSASTSYGAAAPRFGSGQAGGRPEKRSWLPRGRCALRQGRRGSCRIDGGGGGGGVRCAIAEEEDASPTSPSTPAATAVRPVVILPGLGNNSADYVPLSASLKSLNIPSLTLPVRRADWLRNALGLADVSYWRGTLRPRPVLDWYLTRVAAAVDEAYGEHGSPVSIVAHSAGGWLARVYMAEFGPDKVKLLLTLGSPHRPPPKGVPGVVDQTRGLLDYVEANCPGAFHDNVRYVCVAGKYTEGARLRDTQGRESGVPATVQQKVIGQGYKMVCGEASVWGDGVVPIESATLDGADNVILEGVYHSPVGAVDSAAALVKGEGPPKNLRPWYGSPSVLEKWVHYLLE
eukprot:jgi/Chlat1/671/Chrsp104S01147